MHMPSRGTTHPGVRAAQVGRSCSWLQPSPRVPLAVPSSEWDASDCSHTRCWSAVRLRSLRGWFLRAQQHPLCGHGCAGGGRAGTPVRWDYDLNHPEITLGGAANHACCLWTRKPAQHAPSMCAACTPHTLSSACVLRNRGAAHVGRGEQQYEIHVPHKRTRSLSTERLRGAGGWGAACAAGRCIV